MEWPLAASAADRPVDAARPRAGVDRLPTAMADFFLDEMNRLTDEERALMAAMLRGLVADVADEVIAALPPLLCARAELLRDGIYRKLRDADLLERAGVVALLLRRADEQQLNSHAGHQQQFASELIGDAEPAVAEAAMGLTLARGRRKDRFGRLGAEFDDLPAEDAVELLSAVAAAIAHGLNDESDSLAAAAAQSVLARHDEGRRLEAHVARLARALASSGRDDDETIGRCAADGDAALLAGLLCGRAGIDQDDAWRLFTGGEAMMVARLAGCERATAARILAAFEPMSGVNAADRYIDSFDAIDDSAMEERRSWLRLSRSYRKAREAFADHG